jgi:hypothetical protein
MNAILATSEPEILASQADVLRTAIRSAVGGDDAAFERIMAGRLTRTFRVALAILGSDLWPLQSANNGARVHHSSVYTSPQHGPAVACCRGRGERREPRGSSTARCPSERSPVLVPKPVARPTPPSWRCALKTRELIKGFGVAVSTAALVVSIGAGAALAGEVTGSGKKIDQNQGRSWCSFSGLNDRLAGEGPTDSQAQSFGQQLKAGISDPHVANPGFFCNPNHTPLGPNPNRKH